VIPHGKFGLRKNVETVLERKISEAVKAFVFSSEVPMSLLIMTLILGLQFDERTSLLCSRSRVDTEE
jgi:hypothetical protein